MSYQKTTGPLMANSHPGSYCGEWTKVGALCATDYKWVQQEQVEQGKIIPVIR